jgi:glycosyltransferase involved in cell wall biosynthesis
MLKVFYFYLDSKVRRKVARGEVKTPGSNYMMYGADLLSRQEFLIHHNLEDEVAPSPWASRFAWLVDKAIKAMGGSSGDFQTVFREWRRCRQSDIVVSTVDNVGVPLAYLNFFRLLRRPLLYISIGLPERVAAIRHPMIRALYRTLYRKVPRFVTYGWAEAIQLREWLGLPPDSDRVVFIPFGVDPIAFRPEPNAALVTDVLSIGADMQRDFHLLLAVAAQQPTVSFQIITSTRHAATFRNIPPNVRVLTDVPFPEIRTHLASAKVVVFPCHENTYSSGTTTLLQAMAMAKAVVVSRTGAIRDGYQLADDVNCRLVTPGACEELGKAIHELVNTSEARIRLGGAARQTVEAHLTWSHYVKRLANVMTCLTKQHNKNPTMSWAMRLRLWALAALISMVAIGNQIPMIHGQFRGEDELMQRWTSIQILNAYHSEGFVAGTKTMGGLLLNEYHPPLRFLLSLPGLILFPDIELGVRFGAILCSLVMVWMLGRLGTDVGGTTCGWLTAAFVACSGVFAWTSMAFGWSVTVVALAWAARRLMVAPLNLESAAGWSAFRFANIAVLIAFLINTGNILFFLGLLLLFAPWGEPWRAWRLLFRKSLSFILFYGLYYATISVFDMNREESHTGGQFLQNMTRLKGIHLGADSFMENIAGIQVYWLPLVGPLLLAIAVGTAWKQCRRILVWFAPFLLAWSFVLHGNSQQYFLLASLVLLPWGIAGWICAMRKKGLMPISSVLLILTLLWNIAIFVRPYSENDHPAASLRRWGIRAERFHNLVVPYDAIARDVNSILVMKPGGLIHDLEGAFTGYYFLDIPALGSHSRNLEALGSSKFPIIPSGQNKWLLAGKAYDQIAVVVTRKELVSDRIIRSMSYPGSSIRVYELE